MKGGARRSIGNAGPRQLAKKASQSSPLPRRKKFSKFSPATCASGKILLGPRVWNLSLRGQIMRVAGRILAESDFCFSAKAVEKHFFDSLTEPGVPLEHRAPLFYTKTAWTRTIYKIVPPTIESMLFFRHRWRATTAAEAISAGAQLAAASKLTLRRQ